MKVLKVIYGIFAILFVFAAVIVAFAYEGGLIKDYMMAWMMMICFAVIAALCVLGVKCANDAIDIIESRKSLQKNSEENAPTSANR